MAETLEQDTAAWSGLAPAEIVRRARCEADQGRGLVQARIWRECCDTILDRLPADKWQPIDTAPEGVELLVRGGRSVFGVEQRGTSVAIIEDHADLYRPDGTLKPSSPTMWRPCPPPPTAPLPTPVEREGA